MDGEWENVKAKAVYKPKPKQQVAGSQYGGMTAKGTLVAGPIQQSKYGGSGAYGGNGNNYEVVNHASTVADYDFGIDNDEETKYEMVSHVCSAAVA